MKKANYKLQFLFFLLLLCIPIKVFAYSNEIIPSGENIGIHLNTDGIVIVGFYEVNGTYLGQDAGLALGDRITKVNGKECTTIEEMVSLLNASPDFNRVVITFKRDQQEKTTHLKLIEDENGVYKTGLYVKDQINGIGTLTYIDPNTKIYGALGHEIADKNTMQKVEIKDGHIFRSEVTNITKSETGSPGEKNAKFYNDERYGDIKENEESGIFGTYQEQIPQTDAIEVGKPDDVTIGEAEIRTVLSGNTVENFKINILKIDKKSATKNILFEITDDQLLNQTGGVVQGMSGSPIIQNGKIIGAVTHVIVNDAKKGYGIFITTMLEEGEN